ncbi:MAG: ABC transporter ATP-binding protein, partial [Pelagibacteraceae bacterium]|nr:ABC transporter ATP-binding protein [Pelagibacteraceae bacterium]
MSDYNFSIEAKNLNKTYNKKRGADIKALINFNINIPKGSIYGLLGPNGAGKSTFINILGSLVIKDSGKVKICGIDIDEDAKESRKKIGIVPQELNIDPFFTPIELLELQAGLYGVRKKDRKSEEILSHLGLLEQKNAYARTLSGGMRRRLLVAKALVHNPEIIILDEPTAGVDVELRKNLWNYIKDLNNKGTTICLTTHYLEEAENLCDHITIINKGKILKSDTKENILNLIGKKTVSFALDEKIQIPYDLNRYNPVINNNKLLVNYDKNITQLKEIIEILNKNNISFYEINTYESDLEDVFINLITGLYLF